MNNKFTAHLESELQGIENAGLYKHERIIRSPQSTELTLDNQQTTINLCSNNYLGLANSTELIGVATEAIREHGYGMASVRFICGTQDIHRQLEQSLSEFLGMGDSVLYAACYDANCGLFETLFSAEDAIISDSLNHASVIDGIRLCKAKRYRYANNNMQELEARLIESQNSRFRLIATDGVFSMDGIIANLAEICALADKYDALVMVDDSHAVGVLGTDGKGTHQHCDVMGRIDFLTGTFGKALGGASGGYIACKSKQAAKLLRQRSRTYLFSNSLAPVIVKTTLHVVQSLMHDSRALNQLTSNACYFRECLNNRGLKLSGADHPIIPVMIGDAALADKIANHLLKLGVYVIGFSYPVVPKGEARIRTQVTASHTLEQLEFCANAFQEAINLYSD
jgi:glycine C-acetyltransferase